MKNDSHHLRAAKSILGTDAFALVGEPAQIAFDDPATPQPDQATLDAIEAAAASLAFTEKILTARAAVVARADQLGRIIAGLVPTLEMHSWADKRVAADAVQAGETTNANEPRIEILLGELSVTQPAGLDADLSDLAAKVLSNVDLNTAANFYRASGALAGQRRVTEAAIMALTDPATVDEDIAAILAAAEANAQALLQSLLSG